MPSLSDLFGGGQVTDLTSADLVLNPTSKRVTVITTGGHSVILPDPLSITASGLLFLIVNKSGGSVTIKYAPDNLTVATLANNTTALLALGDKCDGSGLKWFSGTKAVADTHTAVAQAGRASACVDEETPPDPAPPPGNCHITAYHTGQDTTPGGSCPQDNRWSIDGNPAKVTHKIDSWINPPSGAKWVASLCDTSSADENGTEHDYTTTVVVLDDATTRVQGQIAVDNYLVDILINGTSTGITISSGGPFNLNSFELTRGNGLVTGNNTIVFKTKQDDSGGNNPFGLAVFWKNLCDGISPYSPYADPYCQVSGYNTGQKSASGTPCNTDAAWKCIESGTQAKITLKRPQWVSPPFGSAWISAVCDSYAADAADTVRSYETQVTVPNDDVLSIKGSWASDNWLVDITVNTTSTGISQITADSFAQLQAFEITRAMGLVTGVNTIRFVTKNRALTSTEGTNGVDPNPHGLLVAWDQLCAPSATCDATSLATCAATKTATISGGTDSFAKFNGVWTLTKPAGQNYWRVLINGSADLITTEYGGAGQIFSVDDGYIDLQCVANDIANRWQIHLNGNGGAKRFGNNDAGVCPPNGTYTCFVSTAEGTDCVQAITAIVSD